MRLFRTALASVVLCLCFFLSAAESPHGVCAHLCRGEFRDAEEEFGIFRELGLGAVRVSFPWKIV